MKHIGLAALLLACAAPAITRSVPSAPPPSAAQPRAPVDPQRLALARATVDALFPAGSSARMVTEIMGGGVMGGMLDLRASDIGMAEPKRDDITLREELKKKDPHFEQRMAIIGKVISEEMARLAPQIETPLREGLAESVARRFTVAQLGDINRFFATDSGKAFGREMLLLWIDPAVIKGTIGTMPVLMKEMPVVMRKVDAATAHLPKPKPKAEPKK